MGNCADLDDDDDYSYYGKQDQLYTHIYEIDKNKYRMWRKPIEPIYNINASDYYYELLYAIDNSPQLASVLNKSYFLMLPTTSIFNDFE